MAYKMKSEGLDKIQEMLDSIGDRGKYIASFALYEGANEMANAINQEAKSIVTAPFHYAAVAGATTRLPSPEEKQILLENGAMGIAKFSDSGGGVDTSVGYNQSGYVPVNWNHMSSKARTNYKMFSFKGRDITASSTLRYIRDQGGSVTHGLSKDAGRHAQNMKPVGAIANAINSGTSFMKKQPFIRRGRDKGTPKAIAAIIKAAEAMMQAMIKENESGGKSA